MSWSETQRNKETMKPDRATTRQLPLDRQSMPPAPHKPLSGRSVAASSVDLTAGKMLRDHEVTNTSAHHVGSTLGTVGDASRSAVLVTSIAASWAAKSSELKCAAPDLECLAGTN